MHVETLRYDRNEGWPFDVFPKLEGRQVLLILFGASRFVDEPQAITELSSAYPHAHMIGCSTSGEIFGESLTDDSLCVAVMAFDQTELASTWATLDKDTDSYQAGRQIAHSLHGPGLQGVLVLSDGLQVNGSELVRGINEVLPEEVVVTGGLAGDGDRFERTWVIKGRAPATGCVTAVGFYGDHVKIGHGSKGGWDIFGPERRVTRSNGNVLYELDDQPALRLYKKYLGDRACELPASALLFPLALRSSSDDSKQIVRTVLAVDEAAQSMTFAGDIPQGWLAQLMKSNLDRLVDGSGDAALMTKRNNGTYTGPILSIAISCVGRRLVLGERAEDELEAAMEALPEHTQQIGFYSYGEISPYATGHCDLHNQTMTLTTITEI